MEVNSKLPVVDVTISTINYNISKKLLRCIDSFLQSYEDLNYEWYIIDNTSQDYNFDDIIKKYSQNNRIIFFKNDKNEGLSVLNKFLDKAKGKFWVFLDPDTIHIDQPIIKLMNFLNSHPKAGMATAKQLKVDGKPLLYYNRKFTLSKIFFRQLIFGRAIDKYLLSGKFAKYHAYLDLNLNKISEIEQATFGCTMERMQLLKADGYIIDPKLSFWYNDVDLCKRLRDKGYKIYLVPFAEIIHDHGSAYKKRDPIWLRLMELRCQLYFFKKHHLFKAKILKILLISQTSLLFLSSKLRRRDPKNLILKLKYIINW